MTQILARTTTLLDGRKTVRMTGRVYLRAIVPIGFFFSLSLICGNLTYLYLSVAFIQMLKVSRLFAHIVPSAILTVWICVGDDASGRPSGQLGSWRLPSQLQGALQRLVYRRRRHHRVARRDQVRPHRLHLSSDWDHV